MKDFSKIRSKMIGLCFFNDTEREAIHEVWDKSFQRESAFLYDIPADTEIDIPSFTEKICLEAGKNGFKPREAVIFTCFLDARFIKNDLHQTIAKLVGSIATAATWSVALDLQFMFLGKVAFYHEKEQLRESVISQMNANCVNNVVRHVICLLSQSALDEGYGEMWNTVSSLLCLLRRSEHAPDMVPTPEDGDPSNDVCILQYLAFNRPLWDEAVETLSHLGRKLSAEGDNEFRLAWGEKKKAISEDIINKFPCTAEKIAFPKEIANPPQKGIIQNLFHRQEQRDFDEIIHKAISAIMATGSAMDNAIHAEMEPYMNSAESILKELFEKADTGIEYECNNEKVREALNPNDTVSVPSSPKQDLINRENALEEICRIGTQYLEQQREYSINKCLIELAKSMSAIHKEIPESIYDEKRDDFRKKRDKVESRQKNMVSEEKLFDAFVQEKGFISNFNPKLPGGSNTKHIIYRGNEQDAAKLESKYSITDRNAMCVIDPNNGELINHSVDELIVLRILGFDCDERRMKDLIPSEGA